MAIVYHTLRPGTIAQPHPDRHKMAQTTKGGVLYAASAARASHSVVPPPGAAASGGGSGGDALFLYGCVAGAVYSPRGRLVFVPLAQVSGSRTTSLFRFYLEGSELPTAWYNVRADMKNKPASLLNPGTLKPMTAKEPDGVFCDELVRHHGLHPQPALPPRPDGGHQRGADQRL